ncbi:PepSY domain-containing protein [uncultured Hyphomicrobium sp.]|uniref:PepSY domain-containing protein n=1 Tax=uncultured Hyphomicrobium sp. TaxID=194373 RepID=UPI0025FFE3E6|nr:PepSY domain-containing protein [uncultured Hyphomicrobium sp.]
MMKLLTAAALSLALAAPAFAGDDDYIGPLNVPRDQWLSTSDIVQKLESKGFKVREIEVDDGAYEFEATDAAGARIEGHAHPATGEVLSTRPDND